MISFCFICRFLLFVSTLLCKQHWSILHFLLVPSWALTCSNPTTNRNTRTDFTHSSKFSIVDFEQVNASRVLLQPAYYGGCNHLRACDLLETAVRLNFPQSCFQQSTSCSGWTHAKHQSVHEIKSGTWVPSQHLPAQS